MKKLSVVLMILLGAGTLLTSCEKEVFNAPGNQNASNPTLRGGEGTESSDSSDDDDDEDITDGGRDEDYDKSGKSKKPKPN